MSKNSFYTITNSIFATDKPDPFIFTCSCLTSIFLRLFILFDVVVVVAVAVVDVGVVM